jgi:hypothetical protein
MVVWIHCYGPEVRQNIMVVGACRRRRCSPHGSQEAETERRGQGQDTSFKAVASVAYFLQPDRTFTIQSLLKSTTS